MPLYSGYVIKCACGLPDCKIELRIEDADHIWLTGKNGESSLMYLTIGSLNFLVEHLQEAKHEKIKQNKNNCILLDTKMEIRNNGD